MRALPAMLSLLLIGGTAACGDAVDDMLTPRPTGCYIGDTAEPLHLSAEQTFHAATIAAVGHRDGMDERAVAVAIATAFQESKLSNVDYGDHDSLGLFQQRPSVGWGTEEEILDPVYASFKFYEKLRRTDGWQDMEIGDAAQAVQVSAYPDLYDQWEDDGLAVAAAFAGGEEAGLSCIAGGAREVSTDAALLAEAYAYQWGTEVSGVDGQVITIGAEDAAAGWNRASWAVAKSYEFDIASVTYAGMRWEPGENGWVAPEGEVAEVAASDALAVTVALADPA
ncbi:hypothetical protein L0U85_17205 [Glycomyces sp. L485]|uniref:hypothetical protein n=1 Tax=Glycomyces sp. L485 TaxID=2909235 RepID=UPI001F4A184F|nr:hypothetical protein [Glycomyces sp. L485]MCH7232577.1 hypothetical protein [Glycomyces sp. L485]